MLGQRQWQKTTQVGDPRLALWRDDDDVGTQSFQNGAMPMELIERLGDLSEPSKAFQIRSFRIVPRVPELPTDWLFFNQILSVAIVEVIDSARKKRLRQLL